MPNELDVVAIRLTRNELTKRSIDISRADISAKNGVVAIRGQISMTPGTGLDLEEEIHHTLRNLRGRPEIRDVVMDAKVPTKVTKHS